MGLVVQVKNLHKRYGTINAVDDISFEIQKGEIFGFVGPNGAGKTTTIECLEGLRHPDSGFIRVLGFNPQRDGQALRTQIGIQLQQSSLPDRIKVWEALDLYHSFYPKANSSDLLLNQLGLSEKKNAYFSFLSGGQKQRLFIALALQPDPQLLFLDEITTGLDPQARHAIWDLIRNVRSEGKTIIMTTHFMEEVEKLCDRVAIMNHGKIIALDSPQNLIQSLGAEECVSFSINKALPKTFQHNLSGTNRLEIQGNKVIIFRPEPIQTSLVRDVVNLLEALSIKYHTLHTAQPTLEDVFLNLTCQDIRE